jgi:hypothetical protein
MTFGINTVPYTHRSKSKRNTPCGMAMGVYVIDSSVLDQSARIYNASSVKSGSGSFESPRKRGAASSVEGEFNRSNFVAR